MEHKILNGIQTFAPQSRKELMQYAFDQQAILVAVNAEKILHATDESRTIINRNVGYPDGIGAVWALKKKGCTHVVKIPGCELWLNVIKEYETSKTFYLVGGSEEVIQATVKKLKKEFPNLTIVNFRNGYLKSEEEREKLIQDVTKRKPDVIFVAMGSPKQELLMEEMYRFHPAVYQGLGGSFDVYTGKVNRAPQWWVKNNLEWAYRLVKQPSRIKRQIHLIRFFILLQFNRL
ncbi:WecB/TagA/CpsF family glycosyltransferase [uncultured Fluviicola sp.]|uniref:WecB/TagA/CpsF family glycosyltransferase n=1 Tax=uncultured Fluviicola sp. TaxID=463303 RepID=UPI0025EB98D5|nr:WecB/TagA/CpsF family glycosyltransferase [uncultured Fluviicola sp.]